MANAVLQVAENNDHEAQWRQFLENRDRAFGGGNSDKPHTGLYSRKLPRQPRKGRASLRGSRQPQKGRDSPRGSQQPREGSPSPRGSQQPRVRRASRGSRQPQKGRDSRGSQQPREGSPSPRGSQQPRVGRASRGSRQPPRGRPVNRDNHHVTLGGVRASTAQPASPGVDGPPCIFRDAKRLLTHRYEDLPSPQDNTTGDELEKARYEAEVQFFDCTEATSRDAVEALLERIVSHRYRDSSQKPPEIIDLKGIPARRVIAAERLFHRKLIKLNGMEPDVTISVGLDTSTSFDNRFGPEEKYQLYLFQEAVDVSCIHRSESYGTFNSVWRERMGEKFTNGVGKYAAIKSELQLILDSFLRGSRKELVEVFREICRGHQVSNSNLSGMGATSDYRDKFLRNCVHILHFEQSQHQSACFFERDENRDEWKLGMTVSFARLIKMLHDEKITLDNLFSLQLYKTEYLMGHFDEVRRVCREIDEFYKDKYEVDLTKDQAIRDLEFLYGDEL